MTTVVDPKGNRLVPVILQVIERDADNQPKTLRFSRDDEKIDLLDHENPQFLIVWSPSDLAHREASLSSLLVQFYDVKAQAKQLHEQVADVNRQIDWVRGEHAKMTAELETKTAELRKLQRERDPERVDREVAARVDAATAELRVALGQAKVNHEALKREIDELKAAKKKLREALERAKGRKP